MTGIREQRAAAIRRHWRDLGDSLDRALPALLDDLDAIDAGHRPEPAASAPGSVPLLTAMPPTARETQDAPARPAPRRRTR